MVLDCRQGLPSMGDPRGAKRKARKRKCKLSICQSVILGVSRGLASTSHGWRRLRASSTCDLPWFLPSLCTCTFLPAVKGKGHFTVEFHNLFGRAIFTRDCSLIHFPVRSHEESSCHICESRMAGRAAQTGAAARRNGCGATAGRNLRDDAQNNLRSHRIPMAQISAVLARSWRTPKPHPDEMTPAGPLR